MCGRGRAKTSARRDPPPLRFGAALSCFVSRLEIGRDVGLAKSGFRPTSWSRFSASRAIKNWLLRSRFQESARRESISASLLHTHHGLHESTYG
jgi:hypothetical protein